MSAIPAQSILNWNKLLKGKYMSIKQIANGKARDCVINRQEFRGSNLYALWNDERTIYKVCSFGDHHPLFVYDANAEQWYENMSYASKTTSKHRTQTRPNGEDIIPLHANDMGYVAKRGAVGLIMAADARAEEQPIMTAERLGQMLARGFNGTSNPTKLVVSASQVAIAKKLMGGNV